MSPLKKDRYQQVADLINGLKKKEHEQTEIDIPIRIDLHTTSVRISYHDGPIPEAIGYDFIANRNGKIGMERSQVFKLVTSIGSNLKRCSIFKK